MKKAIVITLGVVIGVAGGCCKTGAVCAGG
jgi:hypothetical protein